MFDEIKELTCRMVAIPSVNTTSGERTIGLFIEDYIRKIPYFQIHPEYVYTLPLKNDTLGRQNVVALLKGTALGNDGRTILCHGHTDTVGVNDFGKLEPLAFSCKELMDALKGMDLDPTVREDLDSGNWLFGRGACDMKGGVAVFLVLLRYLSEHPERLKGNLLFAFNPVEENLHTGILETLPLLQKFQRTEGLRYLFAINNDYTCPAYTGDSNHYIYAGAVGKLLPCFYIQGKETHVGQCFEGFDTVTVMTELIRKINLNPEFCDVYGGESTLPPSVLYSRDLKDFYNVQTAASAVCYFNYFVHNEGSEGIINRLKHTAQKALHATETEINRKYAEFCKVAGIRFDRISNTKQVYTYKELVEAAQAKAPKQVNAALKEELQAGLEAGEDKRLLPIRMVRKLLHLLEITTPVVVLYFAAPYCPHTTLKGECSEESFVYRELAGLARKIGMQEGRNIKMMRFYPNLSDSSYLKMDDDASSLELLLHNFPGYEALYPVPFDRIRELSIPAVNYGVYGKDAHKWTERIYMPYSFDTLPKLILETVYTYLM